MEERLSASEASRSDLEQQLALARSQLADSRALMDSTQVGRAGGRLCRVIMPDMRRPALSVTGADKKGAVACPALVWHSSSSS